MFYSPDAQEDSQLLWPVSSWSRAGGWGCPWSPLSPRSVQHFSFSPQSSRKSQEKAEAAKHRQESQTSPAVTHKKCPRGNTSCGAGEGVLRIQTLRRSPRPGREYTCTSPCKIPQHEENWESRGHRETPGWNSSTGVGFGDWKAETPTCGVKQLLPALLQQESAPRNQLSVSCLQHPPSAREPTF